MNVVTTDSAPVARGHYSQAIVHAGLVYVAGPAADRPARARHEAAGLRSAGAPGDRQRDRHRRGRGQLARAHPARDGLHRRRGALARVQQGVCRDAGAHKPARTVVPVPHLHYGYLVEMDAIAALTGS
jgi:enamine deaminase RidA (YjgF/YER057c/UK114 family)